MKNNAKAKIPQLLRITGLIIIVLGIVAVFVLPPKIGPVALWIIIVGMIIGIIPNFISNRVYVCPKCKLHFKRSHSKEIVPVIRIEGLGEVLTCPECNKTSFCWMKLVLPSKDNKIK